MSMDEWLVGRRGQALAAAIGMIGLVMIWVGIVDPARSWFGARATLLEERRELLRHMRDLAAGLPALRAASAAKRGEGPEAATITLPGESDAVAAADLQERLQKMAADAGATLTAVETLPAAAVAGGWHKVALRISLNASWPVLVQMVRAIEQSPTRILIDDIHFRSPVAVAHPEVLPIQASVMLYGFRPVEPGHGT